VKLGLIGDPVAHSRSPELQNVFLRDADLGGSYVAIRVPKGNGIAAVRRLAAQGYTGINITTPLKEEVIAACDALDEDALAADAVKPIFLGAPIVGANTDGIGVEHAGVVLDPRFLGPELRAAVRHLIEVPEACRLLGGLARDRVLERYSLAANLDRLIELYRQLAPAPPAAVTPLGARS